MATVRLAGNFLDGKADVFSVPEGTSIEQIIREHTTGDEFSSEKVECYDCGTGKTFYAPLDDSPDETRALVAVNGGRADISYRVQKDDVVEIIITPASGSAKDWVASGIKTFYKWSGTIVGLSFGSWFGGVLGFIWDYWGRDWVSSIFGEDTTKTTLSALTPDSLPDVRGSANQPLTDNPIPAVIGKHLTTPFIVGSPWNEITGEHGEENYIHILYAVGYAPLRITELKLGDMHLAHNQPWDGNESLDCVFTGTLHGTNGNSGEIVNTWSNNDISIEILQQHQDKSYDVSYGSIYPDAKIQQDISANVLYILDNSLAESETVSYRGAGLENGLRNNVVRFTEQYPLEIQVELDFSQGLYKAYTKNTKKESYTKYEKIPLWVAIQWRVYSEENPVSDGNESGVFDIPAYSQTSKSYTADGKKKRPWVSFDSVNSKVSSSAYTQSDNSNDKTAHTGNHLDSSDYNSGWVGAKVFNLQELGFSQGKDAADSKDGLNEFRCVTKVNLLDWAKQNLMESGDTDETFADKFRSYFFDATNTAKAIEVRIVRLSPNYIDETVSTSDDDESIGAASFSDLFTWKTLTTTVMDSEKLSSDNLIEARKPLSEDKMRKMCLIAIKAKTDTTDQIGSQLSKFTCTAQSFSPYYDPDSRKWVPENVVKTTRYFKPSWTDSNGKIRHGAEITKAQYETDRQNGTKSLKFSAGNDFTQNIVENVIMTDSHFKVSAQDDDSEETSIKLSFRWTYSSGKEQYKISGAFIKAEWDTSKLSSVKVSGTFTLGGTSPESSVSLSFSKSGEEQSVAIPSTDITQKKKQREVIEIKHGNRDNRWTSKGYRTYYTYSCPDFLSLDTDLAATATLTAGGTSVFDICKTVNAEPDVQTAFFQKSVAVLRRYVIPESDGTMKYCGNNVASMFLLAGIGQHTGRDALGYSQSGYDSNGAGDFDLNSLAQWYEWAEDVTDGSTYSSDGYHYEHSGDYVQHSKGDTVHMYFTANAYLYKSQQLNSVFSKIAVAGRSVYIRDQLNRIKVITDKKEDCPVAMITAQNTLKSSGTLSYSELPSGLQIPYSDENDGYAQNTIYCMSDGEDASAPRGNIEQYSLDFVTNNFQAWSLGRYVLANRLLNRESVTKQIGPEGASIEIGDIVLVQDDNMLIGTDNGGRITQLIEDSSYIHGFLIDNTYEYDGGTTDSGQCKKGVMVMQPVLYDSSRIMTMRLANEGYSVTVENNAYELSKGSTNLVLFESPISKSGDTSDGGETSAYKPAVGNIVAFGEIGKITEPYRVTNVKEDEKHSFTFTLIKYTDELYSYGRELPTFQNNMTVPDRSSEDQFVLKEKDLTAVDLKNIKSEIEAKIKNTETEIIEEAPTAPADVASVSAVAEKDGITLSAVAGGSTIYDNVKNFVFQISRDAGTTWESVTGSYYSFDRSKDGYPEKSDFVNYKIRAKALSSYNLYSENWVEGTVSASGSYKTWEAPAVSVSYLTAAKDGLKAGWEANTSLTYGDMRYSVVFYYDGEAIKTIASAMLTQAEYTFDRDTDGYPEKSAVNAKLKELGTETKGRSVELYSVKVSAYTVQKPSSQQSSTLKCSASGYGTWLPGGNTKLTARASQDGITAEMTAVPESGEYGTPYRYEFGIKRGEDGEWETRESDSPLLTSLFSDGEYPEASELLGWSVRCRPVSSCGLAAISYRTTTPDTTSYGTWLLGKPKVATRVSDRSITLVMSLPAKSIEQYGTTRYRIQIRKPGTDAEDVWLKPGLTLDPYADEENYKDGDGYIETGSVYVQTMPLTGQSTRSISDTLYQFRVTAVNEAHESEANSEVFATALCTSIQDIVKANETAKSAYISALSAISANIGTIKEGSLSGNDRNFWNLSTFIDESTGVKRWQGAMRVGGDDQYLEVKPIIVNGEISGYDITFKVGNFEISSTASNINGELVIMRSADALDRTRITPDGTLYEHRETAGSEWTAVSQMTTAGILTSAVISNRSLIVTNMGIQERRLLGHDIGRPYLSDSSRVWHFDTDLNDQNQTTDLAISAYGEVSLVDSDTDGSIDYTPAILAVAPYSETARSLFGQYQLKKSIGATSTLTVDFWMQYIWCEDQILFDIGTTNDKVKLAVANSEAYWNTPGDGEPPWNAEQAETGDVNVWNEPGEASTTILHYGKSNMSPDADNIRTFSQLGISFEPNSWLHIGIVLTAEKISVLINKTEVSFVRYEQAEADIDLTLNADGDTLKNTFVLDELMIDTETAESLTDFAENTDAKIPWGALSNKEKHFILDAEGLETNIFGSLSLSDSDFDEIFS